MLFGESRQDTRSVFFSAWRKYRDKQPLEGVEAIIVQVVLNHPEYHALLENPDQFQDRDYLPEHGETNPFLHLGMHVAIEEQLSMDRPSGIKAYYQRLTETHQDAHAALHSIMECLGEMLWQAQRDGVQPDESVYFSCLDKHLQK
jgi:hypothetical protein